MSVFWFGLKDMLNKSRYQQHRITTESFVLFF